MRKRFTALFICFIGLLLLCGSCTTTRLFEGSKRPPEDFSHFTLMVPSEPQLAPGDKITISIWGHDNLSIGSINSPYMTDEATGRWISLDQAGEVNLPKVGRVKLGGLNTKEAAYQLEQLYVKHLIEPVINIRILNHFVTIIGEINKPGKFRINNESIRLVDLIGQAEGFTHYAMMEEVQLIRKIGEETYNFPLDLTSFANIESKNAYLKPDDIVYIPPKRDKSNDESLSRAIGIASIVTSIALVLSVLK